MKEDLFLCDEWLVVSADFVSRSRRGRLVACAWLVSWPKAHCGLWHAHHPWAHCQVLTVSTIHKTKHHHKLLWHGWSPGDNVDIACVNHGDHKYYFFLIYMLIDSFTHCHLLLLCTLCSPHALTWCTTSHMVDHSRTCIIRWSSWDSMCRTTCDVTGADVVEFDLSM